LLRKLGNLGKVRNERPNRGKLARESEVPRATIAGLAGALGVEPGELFNEDGVTILEEKVDDRIRVVKRYDDFTLDISYDDSRLCDAYRFILEGWDG